MSTMRRPPGPALSYQNYELHIKRNTQSGENTLVVCHLREVFTLPRNVY
jgi:hypothetical protein